MTDEQLVPRTNGTCVSDLDAIAAQIKRLEKQSIGNVVETGRLLSEARKLIKHGDWRPWLKANFEWSPRTATRFVNVYQLSILLDLSALNISLSALYRLADLKSQGKRDQIVEAAKKRRVTFEIAQNICPDCGDAIRSARITDKKQRATTSAHHGQPAPYKIMGANVGVKSRIRIAMNNLKSVVSFPIDPWVEAMAEIESHVLRSIIDRLELIYQTRRERRFDADNR
jgi:hypothetical protein